MKKITSLILVVVMLIATNASVCFASSPTPLSSYNEWDIVEYLELADDYMLSEMNITKEDAQEIINTYYEALYSRAELTEKELLDLGYSKGSIEKLQRILRGEKLSTKEIKSISATYYDYISTSNVNNRHATFDYSWVWSQAPLIMQKDSAAILWKAVNSSGEEIDVVRFSRTSQLDYYSGSTFMDRVYDSQFENIGFNGANVQFQLGYNMGDLPARYAKYGNISIGVQVDDTVTENINYIRIYGQYAHTTIGLNYPSISLSIPESLSLSFSGNVSISPQGGREAIIYSSGYWDYI